MCDPNTPINIQNEYQLNSPVLSGNWKISTSCINIAFEIIVITSDTERIEFILWHITTLNKISDSDRTR